jgi:hypothetical protein
MAHFPSSVSKSGSGRWQSRVRDTAMLDLEHFRGSRTFHAESSGFYAAMHNALA